MEDPCHDQADYEGYGRGSVAQVLFEFKIIEKLFPTQVEIIKDLYSCNLRIYSPLNLNLK